MNVGLVLSGGGVKGIAHIGVIKALEENNIYPTHISGSSAGAVIGAFYAAGYSPNEILTFFKKTPLLTLSRYAFRKPGFIDTDKFHDDFIKYFPIDNFKMLKKNLYVTAVDMLEGKIKIFKEGELIKPLLASAAYPGIFSPVTIDNVVYADGGILDNFPVSPLKHICEQIIGVYISPIGKIGPNKLKHSLSVLDRALRINFSYGYHEKFSDCDLLVLMGELKKYGLFDKNGIDEIFNIGYKIALKRIELFKKSKV